MTQQHGVMMPGRKPVSTGTVGALFVVVAVLGGCRDKATTGPTHVQSKDFASALRLVSGDQQTGQVAAALTQQLVVKVVDAGGIPVEGATVTFQVRGGGGSINPPANTSSVSGLVSATWTLGTSLGANKAVAILTNNYPLDSATFAATATNGPPTIFTLVSGNNQSTNVGRTLPLPLTVKLTDQFGYAISGVRVTWAAGAFSGTVTPVRDTTGADGTAQASWTLGTQATISPSASATVAGLTPLVFSALTRADTGRAITLAAGSAQSGPISSALPGTVSVKVTDQYGNPIVGDTVTFGDSLTGGGSVNPRLATTNASGIASSTWTLGLNAGGQFMRARHTRGQVVNFTATGTVAFSDVFAGNFMACGIAASTSRAYCWGANDAGQLGKGTFKNVSAPSTPVSTAADSIVGPFLQLRALSSGGNSFCGLTVARQLYCWGRMPGQATVTSNVALLQNIMMPPQQTLPNLLAVGLEHYCLSDLSGLGYCTGVNNHGQLGSGDQVTPAVGTLPWISPAPPAVQTAWAVLRAGASHTCGIPRLDPADAVNSMTPRCWGANNVGQVGDSSTTGADVLVPTKIKMPAGVTAFDSTTLTAGAQHTCAITGSWSTGGGGIAFCWGSNGFGQLGDGADISTGTIRSWYPVPVTGGNSFLRIYAGEFHTCAITPLGDAFCWGRNDYGQLGNGTRLNNSTPQPVAGGLKFRSLAVGENFTCGVVGPVFSAPSPSAQEGTVYCWGDNVFGQLGNGTTANNAPSLQPVRVAFQP